MVFSSFLLRMSFIPWVHYQGNRYQSLLGVLVKSPLQSFQTSVVSINNFIMGDLMKELLHAQMSVYDIETGCPD